MQGARELCAKQPGAGHLLSLPQEHLLLAGVTLSRGLGAQPETWGLWKANLGSLSPRSSRGSDWDKGQDLVGPGRPG